MPRKPVNESRSPILRLAAALAFLLPGSLRAVEASGAFSRLTIDDGLSQSSIEIIAEDRYGFLWFGTQEGLNRFDGHRFQVVAEGRGAGSLRDGFIRALVTESDGDLWVGTESSLQHLDVATRRFGDSLAPPGVGVRLRALLDDRKGRLWFAGASGGLWTVRPGRDAAAVRVANDPVRTIAFAGDGSIWASTDDALLRFVPSEGEGGVSVGVTRELDGIGQVRTIHVEPSGALWMGRYAAPPFRYDPATRTSTVFEQLPHGILTIAPAGEGRLWLGGRDAGLTRFDPRSGEIVTWRQQPDDETSLSEDDVAVVHEDSAGSLWVGTWNGGLNRLDLNAQGFRTLRRRAGDPGSLPDDDVTRMAEGPDGRLWTISRNDVLASGDPATGRFRVHHAGGDLTTIAFAGGRLFVGTTTGLLGIDPASGRRVDPGARIREAGLDRTPVDALAADGEVLWAASGPSLLRIDLAGSGSVARAALPLRGELTLLAAGSGGRVWLGFAEGAIFSAAADGESLRIERVGGKEVAARGRLSALVEDGGALWIGTARGVGRVQLPGGGVTWIDPAYGMPSRYVSSILPDGEGRLWVSTNRGLTRLDPGSGQAEWFGGLEGAQSSGYVEGGAARGGASGRFYFAGRGVTAFDPRRVQVNPHRPRVVFSGLEILHRPVRPRWLDPHSPLATEIHAARSITLGADAAVFTVEMTALGVTGPERVTFAHRLDRFDEEWIESGADRRVATYTRLAPGRYVLRAKARSASGLWSAEETVLRIRILPPWWRTGVALAAWAVLGVLVLALLVIEARRRTQVRIALAEQEALRRASVTDPLTGLYNRRFLSAHLRHEAPKVLRAHRTRRAGAESPESLLFAIVDLDNLKAINDAQGHDAGDRAIVAIAGLLQSQFREGDLGVRWGGDEYVVVWRAVDRAQCAAAVDRLRAGAEAVDIGTGASACTVSIGFAVFPFLESDPEALTWEQTLQLADRALLATKRSERNAWTGYAAAPGASPAEVLSFLHSGSDVPLPPAIAVLRPGG